MLRNLGRDLLTLIWPTECVGCGLENRDFCAICLTEVHSLGPLLQGETLLGIGTPVFAYGVYDGPLRSLLVAYKHEGRVGFVRHLAPLLGEGVRAAMKSHGGVSPLLLVPVPSRASRVRERGYHHLDELLRAALRRQSASRSRILHALKPQRGRTGQVGLDVAGRERNASLLSVRRSKIAMLRNRDVVLVDDVITTGATVRAAKNALEQAGARVISVVSLCVATRRDTRQIHETGKSLPGGSRLPLRR